MTDTPPPLVVKKRIKRISPLQMGKMLGIIYGLMGLVFLPFFLLMSTLAPQLPAEQRIGMLTIGAGFSLFVPVMYAVMGFVFGAIVAAIYNLVAKWIGGIEIELE